jgi:hypothetical protein
MKLITFGKEEREKFQVGEEYWTFYMETTNKGNALRNVVRVFKTKLLNKRSSQYEQCGYYLDFLVPLEMKLSDTMRHNLKVYMNGYGLAQCTFYTSEAEAIAGFDQRIEDIAKYEKASDRDKMREKKYIQDTPPVTGMEKRAKEWRESLSPREKAYLEWILENS